GRVVPNHGPRIQPNRRQSELPVATSSPTPSAHAASVQRGAATSPRSENRFPPSPPVQGRCPVRARFPVLSIKVQLRRLPHRPYRTSRSPTMTFPPCRPLAALILLAAVAGLAFAPGNARAENHHTCEGFIDALPATISTQGVWCLRKDLATN